MKLKLSHGRIFNNPNEEQISKIISSLGDENSFIILGKDDFTYIQASKNDNGSFILEYQNGATSQHYMALNQEVSEIDVIKAFQQYLNNDKFWYLNDSWEKIEILTSD